MNERAIAFARLIVDEPHVTFAVGRAEETRSIAAAIGDLIDVVAAFEVIEHLSPSETAAFLSGARDSLAARDGHLILTTPNGAKRRSHMNPYHAQEYTSADLGSMLRHAGFTAVRTSGVYLQPPWPRLEHFANTVPFRMIFRALARAGARHPERCRTLVSVASTS
jgi:hypothetical protein